LLAQQHHTVVSLLWYKFAVVYIILWVVYTTAKTCDAQGFYMARTCEVWCRM